MAPVTPAESTAAGTTAVVSTKIRNNARNGKYRRVATAKVVHHGYCSSEVAKNIYTAAQAAWGFKTSDSEEREELKSALAEALCQATSTEVVYTGVQFTVDGKVYNLGPLDEAATRLIGNPNVIRTWIRSYNDAEMACRMSDFLDTEENIEERQAAAYRYGTIVSNAKFCFDTAEALLRSGRKYSASDIFLIKALKTYALAASQQDAAVKGFVQPVAEHSDVVGGQSRAERQSMATPVASVEARTRFAPAR